jgi:hypothetical protein
VANVEKCDVYVGLYERTRYGRIDPGSAVSSSELEFDEAVRLEIPQLVFVKLLREGELSDPTQATFLERVMRASRENIRISEFAEPDQLEELAADSFLALIPVHFGIQVSRPVFQTPTRLETFVGRQPQIEKLAAALAPGRAVLIHGVGAVGGMGKTELAAHVAHEMRGQFVDGVLWADIQSSRASDLLFQWARAFGGFASLSRSDLRFEYHTQTDEDRRIAEMAIRAEELRRVISGKRVLAVLDGVVDEEDDLKIAPLLNALGECAVIVTSRTRRLRSLASATLIDLERMNGAEALDLVTRILGSDRLEGQTALVAEIAGVVDSLPLALDLAATLLRERPSMQIGSIVEYLRAE